MYYLIEFRNSMIESSVSSNNLDELEVCFERYIMKTRLSDAFIKARQIHELKYKDELTEEEKELIDEKSEILDILFNINYHGYDATYIECNDGYMYYNNLSDNYGMLLGGIEGHFIQELYNDYIN